MSLLSIADVPAPAKLNLFLHVVGRRADGYHLLQSLFVLIDWCDTLHFERRADGRLARHDLGAELPADDLCLRAARALQQASGTTQGADISIDKAVPWGAGMGGGSSDAASTLLALNRLWGLGWPLAKLMPLAVALGADVPFFLAGHSACFVEGIGEKLTPVAAPEAAFAVVKPAGSAETRAVFASPLLSRDTEPVILADLLDSGVALTTFGRNDLQPPAQAVCGEIGEALRWTAARLGNGRMTGSGSAVFAVLDAGEEPAPGGLPDLPAGWSGRICRLLAAHPLAGWAPEASDARRS